MGSLEGRGNPDGLGRLDLVGGGFMLNSNNQRLGNSNCSSRQGRSSMKSVIVEGLNARKTQSVFLADGSTIPGY